MRVLKNNRGYIANLVFALLLSSGMAFGKIDDRASERISQGSGLTAFPPIIKDVPPGHGITDDAADAPPQREGGLAPSKRVDAKRPPNPRDRSKSNSDSDILKVVPQTCVPAKGKFIWNFEEEELINILRQVSDLLCRTIVVNDSVGKNMKMTIIGKSPMTAKDAWDVLMASLSAKGLTLVEQGRTWTVIKRSDSKSFATPIYGQGKQARNNEEIGTLLYRTQHTSQDVLKNVARALISKEGLVESIGDQFVMVIDSNSNIRRLGSIFAEVDVEDAINKIHVIPLKNADAKTVEKQLRDLFDINGGSPRMRRRRPPTSDNKTALNIDKIIADERTNSLIVLTDKESIDRLKEVVDLIDQQASDQNSKGKIHVKKLRFEDAKKIAETLTQVVQQGRSSRYSRRRMDEQTQQLFEGEVKITAHENTNTLVTVASANDYRSLLATINKLDIRKEQVYVEAAILDLQVNDNSDFGINIFSGIPGSVVPGVGEGGLAMAANPGGAKIADGLKSALLAGGSSSNITALGENSLGGLAVLSNFLGGGVAGIVGPLVNGTKLPSFGAVLQALSTSSNVDVLSTPHVVTTNNQPAEMSVGEKVPVIRGTSTVGSGGIGASLGVPLQNVTYEPVKLSFKITPHVGEDNNVRLDIEQEVNEIGSKEKILGQDQYRIRTKTAKTTLVLKDQQTGVIGGLIHHRSTKSDVKVPFLGDIPILGWLFKTRHSDNDRRSLLLVITPYVIRSEEDYIKIIDRKLKEREEFARMYYGGKIRTYNKYINYDRKAGPVSSMILSVGAEMGKVENGGPGDGDQVIIKPNGGESNTYTLPPLKIGTWPNENIKIFEGPLDGAPSSNDLLKSGPDGETPGGETEQQAPVETNPPGAQ